MTPEELKAFIDEHDGIAGSVDVDPDIPGPTPVSPKQPNPVPKKKITFKDGTHITIRLSEPGGNRWEVVDPGTAYKGTAKKPSAANDLVPIIDPNTGKTVKLRDPITGTVIDLPDERATSAKPSIVNADPTEQYIVVMGPDGEMTSKPNPLYNEMQANLKASKAQLAMDLSKIQAAVAAGQIGLPQAIAMADERRDLARLQIENVKNELTQRGQDLNRQSDIERTASSLATAGTNAAMNALPYAIPKGGMANFDKSIANMGKGTVPTYGPSASMPFPFDPSQLVMQLFAQGMAQQSPAAAQQAGVPMREPTGFRAPGGPVEIPEPMLQNLPVPQQPSMAGIPNVPPPSGYTAPIGPPLEEEWVDPQAGIRQYQWY